MLRFLRVRHLAVIDEVEVEFGPGFNVLTGETGAGKSILIEAVGLLLGGRASGDLVRTGESTAIVEAIFDAGNDEILVRREVSSQGRSRAAIQGELTTVNALKERASSLIEVHGQHEHHVLLDPTQHLRILDLFAGLEPMAADVRQAYEAMQRAEADLAVVRRSAGDQAARRELLAFQLNELDRAALVPGEDEQLAATRQVLMSAERVGRLCAESYASLYENDGAILGQLGGVWRRISELAALDPRFRPYVDARESIKSQLEDLASFLRRYADDIEASPAELQRVEERLAALERIKRKYGPTLADAIARRERIRAELDELDHFGERIPALEAAAEAARSAYLGAAQELSVRRRLSAARFARALEQSLAELAMERTSFEVRFGDAPVDSAGWSADGIDAAEFFVSPNPGEELRPLARIVSGGELSRIMLALKTLAAAGRRDFSESLDRPPSGAAPGMIFDEIDAGIGGRTADVVGRKLRALASAFQVLCVTHLPQIAAYADAHYAIEKRLTAGRAVTRVRRLDEAGRIEELARMLGGEAVTEQVRASAREMLAARRLQGAKAKGERKRKGEGESVG